MMKLSFVVLLLHLSTVTVGSIDPAAENPSTSAEKNDAAPPAPPAFPDYYGVSSIIHHSKFSLSDCLVDHQKNDVLQLLELDPKCTQAEVKKGYRKATLKWHPDKNPQRKEVVHCLNT